MKYVYMYNAITYNGLFYRANTCKINVETISRGSGSMVGFVLVDDKR